MVTHIKHTSWENSRLYYCAMPEASASLMDIIVDYLLPGDDDIPK